MVSIMPGEQFKPKYDLLPSEQREIIELEAKENGAFATAEKWHDIIGMSFEGLYKRLKKLVGTKKNLLETQETPEPLTRQEKKFEKQVEKTERKLTKEEKIFLKKLATGEASLEDASKFVAVRTFEKMLRNPDDFKFIDFFRTELLKIKRDEVGIKETWAKEIIGRMFAGQLPPSNCPHCGKSVIPDKKLIPILEGELTGESPSSIPSI